MRRRTERAIFEKKKPSTRLSQEPCWVKTSGSPSALFGERLSVWDMRRMIVEDDLESRVGRIGEI